MNTDALRKKLKAALDATPAVPTPFPPCTDVILSRDRDANSAVDKFFFEYFKIGPHVIFPDPSSIGIHKPPTGGTGAAASAGSFLSCLTARGRIGFPPEGCFPASCITLGGHRGTIDAPITRLFAGDLVWLFFFERMGIFKMLGAVLDDFVTKGRFPIPNDDLNSLIIEAMVRQTKTGLSSTVRDRDGSYRRVLDWTSDVGRKLGSTAKLNAGFNIQFHKFLGLALTWYNDRRLAQAIQTTTTMRKSVATLIAISRTLADLKHAFDEFKHGRNYFHTLSGVVWAVGGLTLIRDLRSALGIAGNSADPASFVPAAYDLLVKGVPMGTTDQSHFSQHVECASNGRDLLIDIEFLDVTNTADGFTEPERGDLTVWLDLVEDNVERYRTAYQGLTGVDLGSAGGVAAPMPTVEQKA